MNMEAFRNSQNFSLHRVANGWVMKKGISSLIDVTDNLGAGVASFESTKSLGEQLPKLLGESGWRVVIDPPVRDAKGHFKKP